MKLYRYLPFDSFVDIVLDNKLTLSSSKVWEDSYEGWLWKAFQNSEKIGEFVEIILNKVFIMCWSKSKDSVVMWNAYRYDNKTIMIEVESDELKEIENVQLREISYKDNANVNDVLKMLIGEIEPDLVMPFTIKRKAFEFEDEVRMIYLEKGDSKELTHIKIGIPPVDTFIKNVLVHPSAPEWYVTTVKMFCEKNNIPFSGKSQLYDLK